MFKSLDEVGMAYIQAFQMENEALFLEGDVVKLAVDQGFKVRDVVSHCASLTRRQKRTVFDRYAVARTFPADKRDSEICWYSHRLCAGTDNPQKWLEIASEGYTDANGEHQGHTTRTLKAAIKASGGKVTEHPVILLDGELVTLQRMVRMIISGNYETVFMLTEKQASHLRELPFDTILNITLMQAPAPEKEAA